MKRWKWLGLFAAFALVLAACSPADTGGTTTTGAGPGTTEGPTGTTAPPGGMAGEGGELLLLQWQAVSQIVSYLSTGTKDLLAGSLVLEPLAEVAPDGSLVPALAEAIPSKSDGSIAEDDTSITWTLKEGLLWADGSPVTADDAVFTWEYCSNPDTGCSQDMSTVASVVAVDERTIQITWTTPQPYPFTIFTTFQQPIIQRAQFADCVGSAAQGCTEQNFAPVGTGPYMVTELRPEDTVTYAYNPNYRGVPDGKPFFGTVTIKGGGDAEASARSVLEIDEADYGWNLQVAPEILGPMEQAGNGVVKVGFTANVEHLNLNHTNNRNPDNPSEFLDGTNPHPIFFLNGDLARALSMAINREEMAAVGYGPAGVPTCTLWPVPGEAADSLDWCLTHDPDGANALLDELGYVDTDDDGIRETPDGLPLEFDLVTSTNAVRQTEQDLIARDWEAIGVAVNNRNEDAGLFFDGTCAADACIWKFFTDIQMYTNGASLPDALGYFSGFKTSEIPSPETNWGGGNPTHYSSPEFDAAWDQLSVTALDDPARVGLVKSLQELVVNDGAIVPLIHRASVSAFGNDIQGVGDLNAWDSEYWNIEEWSRG